MLRFCCYTLLLCTLEISAYAQANNVELEMHDDNSSVADKISSLQSKLRIANNQNKNLHAKILELEEGVRELNGKIQSLEHFNTKISSKVQNLTMDSNNRLEKLEKSTANTRNTHSTTKVNSVNISMSKYFNMIEHKNYQGAIQGLEQYLQSNKSSPTLGEAYYWLGYAYMSSQDYTKAIKMFMNSYKGYPKNPKAEYSLLNMSVSLHRVKEYSKACSLIKKLLTTSQNQQIIRLAKHEEKDFNCKDVVVKKSSKKSSKSNNNLTPS